MAEKEGKNTNTSETNICTICHVVSVVGYQSNHICSGCREQEKVDVETCQIKLQEVSEEDEIEDFLQDVRDLTKLEEVQNQCKIEYVSEQDDEEEEEQAEIREYYEMKQDAEKKQAKEREYYKRKYDEEKENEDGYEDSEDESLLNLLPLWLQEMKKKANCQKYIFVNRKMIGNFISQRLSRKYPQIQSILDCPIKREQPYSKMNCEICGKRAGLLGYSCKYCSQHCCAKHRLPESHYCPCDFTSESRKRLKRQLEAGAIIKQHKGKLAGI